MRQFAQLFEAIDSSTSTKAKTTALAHYFATAHARDAVWAAWFLTGHRPRQAVNPVRSLAWRPVGKQAVRRHPGACSVRAPGSRCQLTVTGG